MIEIDHLQKIVGRHTALDIESLTVARGEIAAVVGTTGSGIDALFDLLLGKSHPSAGSLRVADTEPTDKNALSRKVGIMFAEDALYRHRSPQANLILHCQLYGLPRTRALEVLKQIGMADQANASLDKLPSNLLRRLAFGRAILHKPEALILFEPFSRCDETTISLLIRLVRQTADEGVAVLILSNDAAHLAPICDTVYTLVQGRLVEGRTTESEPPSPRTLKIPVRAEDKVRLVNPSDILFAEAGGGHACLQTGDGRLTTQFTLSELEARLSRSGFFRAHRSYLVNLQHVKEIIPYTRNSFSLRLDDPAHTEIPLSKNAAGELKDLFGY